MMSMSMESLLQTLYPGGVMPDYSPAGLFGLVRALAHAAEGDGRALAALGVPPPRPGRPLLFLLVDGLGDNFLQRHGVGSRLLACRRGRLATVCPSTTAAAVTTVMSGLPPARHGLTGWFIDDARFGGAIAPLPLQRRGDGASLGAPRLLPRLFPYPSLFQRLAVPSCVVAPAELCDSRFNRRHSRGARRVPYEGLAGLEEVLVASLRSHQAPAYVYAYYNRLDTLSHHYGCQSAPVRAELDRLDELWTRLLRALAGSGATLVLSADHGFIDADPALECRIGPDDELAQLLAAPLWGERRLAFARPRTGAAAAFADAVAARWGERLVCHPSRELLGAGFFGPGPRHPRLHERIGELTLVPRGAATVVDLLPGERPHRMTGVHGGLHADEMWVPLLAAHC